MNLIQSIHLRDFEPPALERILAPKSFVFLILNVLTLGVYGAAETLGKQYRVTELKIDQDNLLDEIQDLNEAWDDLEQEFTNLMQELSALDPKDEQKMQEFKAKLNLATQQWKGLENRKIEQVDNESSFGVARIALGTIAFVGQLAANILSLGIYGVYQNYTLKNRVKTLAAENDYLLDQANNLNGIRNNSLKNQDNLLRKSFDVLVLNEGLKNTDGAKAFFQLEDANKRLDVLRNEHVQVKGQFEAIQIQKVAIENGKMALEREVVRLKDDLEGMHANFAVIAAENEQVAREREHVLAEKMMKEGEVANLRQQLNIANDKANKVNNLEREVNRLKEAQRNQPEDQRLQAELGPIAPKYTPRPEDGPLEGALDFKDVPIVPAEDLEPEGQPADAALADYAKAYQNRYIQKPGPGGVPIKPRTANDVARAGFDFAFEELLKMAAEGDKIKFNDSAETVGTPGGKTVYRLMALDLIKGGKVLQDGCHGYILQINDDVAMYPSHPEKVLQYTVEPNGRRKPAAVLRYSRQDDFTPSADALKIRDGVDPVSAKWIYAQLTEEEKGHLFNQLMASVIPNDNPDYQRTRDFMSDKANPRVKLIDTAYDLIVDMGIALDMKFGKSVFMEGWMDHANVDDFDLKPFIKEEDIRPELHQIEDLDIIQAPKGEKVVDWVLDQAVIKAGGEEFYDLLSWSQIKYKMIADNMNSQLLLKPELNQTEFSRLSWNQVNGQYHVSHKMIGGNQFNGGQRCLFSNLLAVFMTDKKELTEANVLRFRRCMAAYLDKLINAKNEWVRQGKPENPSDLKDLADLANAFEISIKRTHNCTVGSYQLWLRNEVDRAYINGRYEYPANINISNLSAFEIELGAFTMGVRMALLPIELQSGVKVDEHGRFMPAGEFYGPNTKEIIMMGSINGTYYGVHPKLNLQGDYAESIDAFALETLQEVDLYWDSIGRAHWNN